MNWRSFGRGAAMSAPITGTGWMRRFRPMPGCPTFDAWRIAGLRSAPAASTTWRARTSKGRGTASGGASAAAGASEPVTPTIGPSAPTRISARTRARSRTTAPSLTASARCARMPDCLAPRRQPKGHDPQSPQSVAFRRISPDSQPSASAPRRMISSFSGTTIDDATPISVSIAATSAAHSSPSRPSSPWFRTHSARTAAGASRQVIQLISVPPPTPEPASIVIAPSQVERRP